MLRIFFTSSKTTKNRCDRAEAERKRTKQNNPDKLKFYIQQNYPSK
jgi:hypothetical protein